MLEEGKKDIQLISKLTTKSFNLYTERKKYPNFVPHIWWKRPKFQNEIILHFNCLTVPSLIWTSPSSPSLLHTHSTCLFTQLYLPVVYSYEKKCFPTWLHVTELTSGQKTTVYIQNLIQGFPPCWFSFHTALVWALASSFCTIATASSRRFYVLVGPLPISVCLPLFLSMLICPSTSLASQWLSRATPGLWPHSIPFHTHK